MFKLFTCCVAPQGHICLEILNLVIIFCYSETFVVSHNIFIIFILLSSSYQTNSETRSCPSKHVTYLVFYVSVFLLPCVPGRFFGG